MDVATHQLHYLRHVSPTSHIKATSREIQCLIIGAEGRPCVAAAGLLQKEISQKSDHCAAAAVHNGAT